MTGRKLAGDLSQLRVTSLLRLLEATSASGVLELEGPEGQLRLEIARGRTLPPTVAVRETLERLKATDTGRFRFVVDDALQPVADAVMLTELTATDDQTAPRGDEGSGSAELEGEATTSTGAATVHHLEGTISADPLADLVEGLQEVAPDELHLAEIGVIASNPTIWRGSLAARWRRRGWNLSPVGGRADVDPESFDVLIIHHHLSVSRVGRESDWLDLLQRAATGSPPTQVLWIGPLTDPRWVSRLVSSDVAFLLPPPSSESGPPLERFLDTVTEVVDRLLHNRSPGVGSGLASRIADVLLPHGGPGEGMAALLHVASGCLRRAAVLEVAPTHVRCRAGLGYPIERGAVVLPRGIGLLERVIRDGEVVSGIERAAAGADHLAGLLGVDSVPSDLCLIPLVIGHRIAGILVGDCEGKPLPAIDELVHIGRWLGGLLDN